MRTLRFLVLTAIVVFALQPLFSQIKTEQRNVTGFTALSVSEGIKLELTLGEKELVEVSADADFIDQIVTELEGTTLVVHIKGSFHGNIGKKNILVKVTAQKMEKVSASSGSSLITMNTIKSSYLKLSSSSGASIEAEVDANKLSVDVSSGSTTSVKGKADEFKGESSSGASLRGQNLVVKNADVDASSGSSISLQVNGDLHAEASSGASINYSGTPTMVDVEKSSGGSVHKE